MDIHVHDLVSKPLRGNDAKDHLPRRSRGRSRHDGNVYPLLSRTEKESLMSADDGWENIHMKSGEVHVIPVRDVIVHESQDCVCVPTQEAVFRDDGSCNWLYIHHSLDGRELSETKKE